MKSIEERLRGYVAENFLYSGNGYPYPDDASFLEEGIVDSMGIMQLVAFLEEELGVAVTDDDLVPANLDSISRLAAFVRRRKPEL